jgi:uncharacterized protein (TIGR03382 family)
VIVATVDTDTIEQGIDAAVPIDFPARIDLVHDAMQAQIEAHSGDAGFTSDAGDAGTAGAPVPSGGCTTSGSRGSAGTILVVLAALAWRRRRAVSGRAGSRR